MNQLIAGIFSGMAILGGAGLLAWLCYTLRQISLNVSAATAALNKATAIQARTADASAALVALTQTNRQLLAAVSAMTAAIKIFNGLVLQQQPQDEPPTGFTGYPPTDYDLPRGPSGRPPAPPTWMENYAEVDTAGVMNQTDEDLAGIEVQREAAGRGEPTVADILGRQTEAEVRGEV